MNKKPTYGPFTRQYKGSLDSRYVFKDDDALVDYLETEDSAYSGMLAYVEASGALFLLDEKQEVQPVEGLEVSEVKDAEEAKDESSESGDESKKEEETIPTLYLHEIVQNSNFDIFLNESKLFKQLVGEVTGGFAGVKEEVEATKDNVKTLTDKVAELQKQVESLTEIIKKYHPDDITEPEPVPDPDPIPLADPEVPSEEPEFIMSVDDEEPEASVEVPAPEDEPVAVDADDTNTFENAGE